MAEHITKLGFGEDYYPFQALTKLNFPPTSDDLVDYEPHVEPIAYIRTAARADFEIDGHLGYVQLQPVQSHEGQMTPLGEARVVDSVKRGKRRLIEAPLALVICSLVESANDYKTMYNTQAKFTLGSATYWIDLIDHSLDSDREYGKDMELELLNDLFMNEKRELQPHFVLPGKVQPVSRVKINFYHNLQNLS